MASKARIIFVEVEGDDAVAEAVHAFAGGVLVMHAPSARTEIVAPAADLPALPAPAAGTAEDRAEPQPPARSGRKAGTPRPPSPSAPVPAKKGGSMCREMVLDELAQGPQTIKGLMGLTGFSYGSIYDVLNKLVAERVIEKRPEGTRIWNHLVKGGSGG